MNKYGQCECDNDLSPVWFEEKEYAVTKDGYHYATGRVRTAVSHLTCDICGKNYCIDDSYDLPWRWKHDIRQL